MSFSPASWVTSSASILLQLVLPDRLDRSSRFVLVLSRRVIA
jgi:hypothetical protein